MAPGIAATSTEPMKELSGEKEAKTLVIDNVEYDVSGFGTLMIVNANILLCFLHT
jgi:hypothetical protein